MSLLRAITDIKNVELSDIDTILGIIKSGSRRGLKDGVDKVRKAKTDKTKGYAKLGLPCAIFNGTFKTKSQNDLLRYSSYIALDFDKIADIPSFKSWLEGFDCVYAYYVTPSGSGIKAIIQHDNYDPNLHYDLYTQVLKLFKCPEIDASTIDLARGHFLSYDPDLWCNPACVSYRYTPSPTQIVQATPFTETIVKGKSGKSMIVEDETKVSKFLLQLSRQVLSDESIIKMLRKTWSGRVIEEGSRNNTALVYAGILCKAGVESGLAKGLIEELIPGYRIRQIMKYAYANNAFGCERKRYRKK